MKVEGNSSPNDCVSNMKALLEAGSPAAQKVSQLNIGGFKDWVIPSRDVLELGYRHFKPTCDKNECSCRDGENSNSLPPGWFYTEESPAQTILDAFKENGEESFVPAWHWSSTGFTYDDTAFVQDFSQGEQTYSTMSYLILDIRAVRLISIDS